MPVVQMVQQQRSIYFGPDGDGRLESFYIHL